jgi:single-strand DNA-binding protein
MGRGDEKESAITRVSTASGLPIARMRIAVNRKRGATNESAFVSAFVNLVALGKTAEFATKHLRKGSSAIVHGRLQTRSYEKDGQPRVAIEILVNDV